MLWFSIYFNLFITLWAYLRNQLTFSAALSALVLGFVTILLGHELFFVLLMVFYISSILIRKLVLKSFPMYFYGHSRKHKAHGARSVVQVLCNGGLMALLSVVYYVYPNPMLVYLASVSMAAANADTWASELGSLSSQQTQTLFSKKVYPKGLSGGVTHLGLWASLTGSALVSIVTSVYFLSNHGFTWRWLILSLGMVTFGFMGSIVDSLLGEYFQVKYLNDQNQLVDDPLYTHSKPVSGYTWIDNNLVNLLSNLIVVGLFYGLLYAL